MTLIIKFDRLNIFIIFIYNSKWIEIIVNLLFNELIINRFNLIIKMFKLKLKAFINDILKKKMFNKLSLIFFNKFIYNKSFKSILIR